MNDPMPSPPDRGLGWLGIFIMVGVMALIVAAGTLLKVIRDADCLDTCASAGPGVLLAIGLGIISCVGIAITRSAQKR